MVWTIKNFSLSRGKLETALFLTRFKLQIVVAKRKSFYIIEKCIIDILFVANGHAHKKNHTWECKILHWKCTRTLGHNYWRGIPFFPHNRYEIYGENEHEQKHAHEKHSEIILEIKSIYFLHSIWSLNYRSNRVIVLSPTYLRPCNVVFNKYSVKFCLQDWKIEFFEWTRLFCLIFDCPLFLGLTYSLDSIIFS